MIRILFTTIVAFLIIGCTSSPSDVPKQEVESYSNYTLIPSTIYTMEESVPKVEAIVLYRNKIIATGNFDSLHLSYPGIAIDSQYIDKTILPGFIDSHTHAINFGAAMLMPDLNPCESAEEMVKVMQDFYPNPTPGEWLIGEGWDEGVWESKGFFSRVLIDEAFPNNPVKLASLHGFATFYNGKAMEVAGISKTTPQPKIGEFLIDESGKPTGIFKISAKYMVEEHIPPTPRHRLKQSILKALNTMAEAGVTSIHEAGSGPETLAAFQELAAEKALPIRCYVMLNGNDSLQIEDWIKKGHFESEDHFLGIRGIKVFYDGSLGSRTALLAQPYADHDHATMTERISPAKIEWLAGISTKNGFQMCVHAIGDEGNNRALGIFENALQGKNIDHRWRIEHAQVVLPDFYHRAGTLGLLASMQSSHAPEDARWAEDRLGSERILHSYAWRNMLNNGVKLLINTDSPGEPWEPQQTLHYAVNRTRLDGTPKGGWYPEQALTVDEAIKAMTIKGAYGAFQDEYIGSIVPGKLADFVVLDQNPFEISKDRLQYIDVIATWIDGKLFEQQ